MDHNQRDETSKVMRLDAAASGRSDVTPENIARFRRDQATLRDRHRTDAYDDPAFNPWYSKTHAQPAPVPLDHLPEAR